MSFQPDMILQYAHFLRDHYAKNGVHKPFVRAEIYVTLNGRPGQLFVDPTINLAAISDSFSHKDWILPFQKSSLATSPRISQTQGTSSLPPQTE